MAADVLDQIRAGRHGARKIKEQRFSVRAFYLTCLVFTVFALVSFWPERQWATLTSSNPRLRTRDLGALTKSDEECRLVHRKEVTDKCAFIRKHCPDEEPGFLAYLNLYYCDLGSVKPIAFIIILAWTGMLFSTIGIAASDFFCINLSTIATLLGMSESLAGVTFLAFGNGSPDVFSTFAAMSTNSSSLAIGELFGAAGFITGVVAGSMALVRPFKVARKSFIRDVGFFAVAAAFSMGFLSDGNLHLWECAAMVIYYVFYVCVVVIWHWYITQRVRRRERDAAARGHFIAPGEELDMQEEYRDDPEENSRSRPSISRGVSAEDFRLLEDGGVPRIEEPDIDDNEEMRDRWLGEIQTNMRLSRPSRGRSNTITPVRPSLVGALEFQSVLRSLNKSRNIQTIPLHQRRYSDEPIYTTQQQHETMSSTSAPTHDTPSTASNLITPRSARPLLSASSGRTRAVSANDAATLQIDPKFLQNHAKQQPPLVEIHEDEDGRLMPPSPTSSSATRTLSPQGLNTPSDRSRSPATPQTRPRRVTPDLLAPPIETLPPPRVQITSQESYTDDPPSPRSKRPQLPILRIPSGTRSPRGSNPPSPFPAFHDNLSSPSTRAPSLFLPPASISVESQPFMPDEDQEVEDAVPPRWWPNSILPSPAVLLSTLIPTLYNWRGKSWFELILSVVAAPSVLLLTVTLPVVDSERDEDEEDQPQGAHISVTNYDEGGPSKQPSPAVQILPPVEDGPSSPSVPGAGAAGVAAKTEQNHHHNLPAITPPAEPIGLDIPTGPNPKAWNRWLTILQLYLSPIMIVLIIYTQYLPPTKHQSYTSVLLRPLLIALLVSTILLIPLLLTTTPTHRPKAYLPILSLAGFIVSIAWISTIASQVVAVLKAFAIILNMSHAIMGLTVFAVGNSLGDLVADITVAKLGYPVMALSACFGGPMLNILLGIGLSGCWILFRGAEKRHRKHPDREWKSGTYEIEVGDTLIVSGVTLLVTLVGLLVAVPLNGWVMSRRIAWVLIGLWCIGTMVNVVMEVVGVGGKKHGE
ncbi:Cation exchanger-like protein [Elsinoe fawcettii]|nr:Cation exchanger-like protein [Elsinoe fawcettii]